MNKRAFSASNALFLSIDKYEILEFRVEVASVSIA
jgi:hypothetical protein